MKQKTYKTLALLLAFIAVAGAGAFAQENRTGTNAASELLIPVGARDLAMGGSSLAITSGVESIYWNPAGLGRLEGSAEGLFSTMT